MKYKVTVKSISHHNNKDRIEHFDETLIVDSSSFDFEKHYEAKSKLYKCLMYPTEIKLISKLD